MDAVKTTAMSVRLKTFVVMTVMSVLAFVAVTSLSRVILEPGSNANEKLRVSDDLQRVRSAVDREIAGLDRAAEDYASRDDTYLFASDRNEAYVRANLTDAVLAGNEFDAVVLADAAGRVFFGRAYDRAARAERPLPSGLAGLLRPGRILLRLETDTQGRSGLIVLDQEAFLVSSRPILNSRGQGPARGTALVARALDARAVQDLGETIHLPLRLVPISDPSVPGDLRAAAPDVDSLTRITGPDRIAGFALFEDILGRPALVAVFELPRAFHGQFLTSLRYFLVAFLVYICLAIGLGQWLMDWLVTSRLIRLTGFMKSVGRSGTLDSRLNLPGRDEVSGLAAGLNAMLEALGRHVEAIKAAEEAVKRSESKYRALFETAADAVFLETQDGRILDCNPAATRLFEHDKASLVGMAFSGLLDGPAPTDQEIHKEQLSDRGFLFVERTGRKRSGEKFPCEISVRLAKIGRSTLIVAIVHDISERARSEEKLRASLREKEVLLREVHHRVKNNMQIISSLFNLQSGTIRDEKSIELLRECQARIRSMALVHEKLYQSKDMAHIHFSDYLRSLATFLFHFWQVNEERVRLDMRIANILLDINTAIPLGLIVNELVSNSLEHAFPSGRVGEIRLRLVALDPTQFELLVEDDGIGLPAGLDIARSETLGLQLVTLLVDQLDGTIEAASDHGTRFRIVVNALKYKQRF